MPVVDPCAVCGHTRAAHWRARWWVRVPSCHVAVRVRHGAGRRGADDVEVCGCTAVEVRRWPWLPWHRFFTQGFD